MIYPNFIKQNDTIGICAPSEGIGERLDEYNESINVLISQGYKIKETTSVKNTGIRSNTALLRAKELDELILDKDVDMIMAVTGGDVEAETLPYINYENIKNNPKWIMGASDPTNLLFPVTTMLDIATIYGFNGISYSKDNKLDQQYNLDFLKGKLITEYSFDKYNSFLNHIKDIEILEDVYWKTNNPIDVSGRCIGGCLDCITKLIGTKYDHINEFIQKYKDDGIVWYFDNFAMSPLNTYLTLLQFKEAGYFKYTKAILFGRVAIPNNDDSNYLKEYEEVYKLALDDVPYISEMDIGHTRPKMTMINGAIINVKASAGKGQISFTLK